MEVYGSPENKLFALKSSKPAYWELLLSRSEYSEAEVEQELNNIDVANAKLQSFLSSAYDLLVWEDGKEMNYFPNGFASDAHWQLNEMLSELSYYSPSFSENSHLNCFPVRKWQKEVAHIYKQIAKVEKFIAKL